jgi:hypothetical protein
MRDMLAGGRWECRTKRVRKVAKFTRLPKTSV